tara:strand:+ start:41666 stop:43399 length:1734 start_codon:yes stop_codon:yes gene_type:complete
VLTVNLFGQVENQPDTLSKYSLDELWDLSYYALDGTDTVKIRAYCNEFLKRAKEKESKWATINAYDYMTWAYPNLALEYNDSIIQLTKDRPRGHYPAQGHLGKANYYQENWMPNKALIEYAKTMLVAQEQGCNDHIFQAKLGVASLRGQWGDYWQALEIYKECLDFAEKEPDYISYHDMKSLYMDIALAYFDNKEHLLASEFIEKGKKLALSHKDSSFYYKLLSIGGYNDVVDGRLFRGLDSLKKAEPHRTNRSFGINQYYQGIALLKLDREEEAVEKFKKMDSLYEANGDEYRELQDALRILIDVSREAENQKRLNSLASKAIYVDSVISSRSASFRKTAFTEYDLPKFLDQRTVFMKKLVQQKWVIIIIAFLLLISVVWGYNNRRKKLLFEERYKKIMESQVNYEHSILGKNRQRDLGEESLGSANDFENETQETTFFGLLDHKDEEPSETSSGPSEITIEVILMRLKKFEEDLGFLDSEVSLNSLAKDIGTNHKYLSMIVNESKGQDFRNYLKDLRITTAINTIKSNRDLTKLSIAELAEKFGFRSPDSFARAFKWKTKITPSKFIKKLASDIS